MRRHADWLSAVCAIAGVALFVLGWVLGWETIEPIAFEGLNSLPGSEGGVGAFGGVVSTPWEWQTNWLTWVAVLAVIGLAVILVRFRSARRAVAGSSLVLLGLWLGRECLSWWLQTPDDDFGWGISPWSLGASVLGSALTVFAGAVVLSDLRPRRSPPPPPVSQEH